jgi:hypothetical protein
MPKRKKSNSDVPLEIESVATILYADDRVIITRAPLVATDIVVHSILMLDRLTQLHYMEVSELVSFLDSVETFSRTPQGKHLRQLAAMNKDILTI